MRVQICESEVQGVAYLDPSTDSNLNLSTYFKGSTYFNLRSAPTC